MKGRKSLLEMRSRGLSSKYDLYFHAAAYAAYLHKMLPTCFVSRLFEEVCLRKAQKKSSPNKITVFMVRYHPQAVFMGFSFKKMMGLVHNSKMKPAQPDQFTAGNLMRVV